MHSGPGWRPRGYSGARSRPPDRARMELKSVGGVAYGTRGVAVSMREVLPKGKRREMRKQHPNAKCRLDNV